MLHDVLSAIPGWSPIQSPYSVGAGARPSSDAGGPRDAYVPSGAEVEPERPRGLSKSLLAGIVMGAAIMAGFPAGAHAQQAVQQPTVSATTRDDLIRLAQSYGLKTEVLQQVDSTHGVADLLRVLPSNMRHLYRGMPAQSKKVLLEQLQGSTRVLVVNVSHRNAFINGEAAGRNVWDEMQRGLSEQFKQKKLDPLSYARLTGAVGTFRDMSPQQRGAFLELLRADVASLR